ncbi:hypothetical protein O181_030689 [Austropuccinia psidii MF-1]|uniref:Chromo domain-containing protein n=1 Tax=Austropuccinia psidii MF-1 TaxID=1389203 RepID=A0A9Q3H5T3_9BASI|nr:hypothetical protein [Austropuccinia psidii MF-1]
MEEILNLTQFALLKILLVERYQQKYNQYIKISIENLKFPSKGLRGMQIKAEQVQLFSILVKWYGFLPRTKNQLNPPKKLSKRWLHPFAILNKVRTHAYHIKLPSQWKSIHPGFHISHLEPVKTSTNPKRHQEPLSPIIIEEEEEWEVSQILDSMLKRGNVWYLVEWKGFSQDSERSTWDTTENLKKFPEPFKDFHSLYPDKPGPRSSRALLFMVFGGERNHQK